jgi:hypothetical protein
MILRAFEATSLRSIPSVAERLGAQARRDPSHDGELRAHS